MEAFRVAVDRYYAVLRACEGGGGQGYIDTAHREVTSAWFQLSEEDRRKVEVPPRQISTYQSLFASSFAGLSAMNDALKK
jgi:hypothetical protein